MNNQRKSGSILIVDDERGQRDILKLILRKEGYDIVDVPGVGEALEQLDRREFDLILTDLKMQGQSGLDLLERVLSDDPQQCVILMTAHGSVDSAVEAMRMGAFDYLEKPLERDNLVLTLQRAFERIGLVRENRVLQKRVASTTPIPSMLGDHPRMAEVFRVVAKIAATTSTVLIVGESGTGKELVARAIHEGSQRRDNPFMAINCAAIPETLIESELFGHEKGSFTGAHARELGVFEAANGGTVFLDEIGEMNVSMQAKLLRAIQEKEVRRVGGRVNIPLDVRIISATNKELEQEIRRGSFREDLYYRLNVIRINLPPLRERGSDVKTLAEFFVKKYSLATGIDVEGISRPALKLLMNYSWPGNVRQLESVIERAVLMAESSVIEPGDLPAEITSTSLLAGVVPFDLPPEGIDMETLEKNLIIKAMERADWVIGKAAPLLGMSYKTLQYRLEKFAIERPDRRQRN
ncbi:sigma-54-dependent transcriptional regulator [Pelobacter propionicus]|uniref:Two component, sigma54 specific, transcriptional regulator, Fis family n=1 Tax=Pelobacter propionicus (strain DSM 2379 / NBRC 103807 / OttBd1) TaxID=338966 RepID=A1AUC3_PELPD|nr:sigma-54 dependent transcriptional regulator [Pelobacter propionicus]ABL00944.1 two component, sigma54 specific, transcriptional regulator, Fis family [Pelobacter propionicus DSM 2379]